MWPHFLWHYTGLKLSSSSENDGITQDHKFTCSENEDIYKLKASTPALALALGTTKPDPFSAYVVEILRNAAPTILIFKFYIALFLTRINKIKKIDYKFRWSEWPKPMVMTFLSVTEIKQNVVHF